MVRQLWGEASVALAYLKCKPPTAILVLLVSNHTIAITLPYVSVLSKVTKEPHQPSKQALTTNYAKELDN